MFHLGLATIAKAFALSRVLIRCGALQCGFKLSPITCHKPLLVDIRYMLSGDSPTRLLSSLQSAEGISMLKFTSERVDFNCS